jgi:hypothetical protein
MRRRVCPVREKVFLVNDRLKLFMGTSRCRVHLQCFKLANLNLNINSNPQESLSFESYEYESESNSNIRIWI